jgi:hypothetical protein
MRAPLLRFVFRKRSELSFVVWSFLIDENANGFRDRLLLLPWRSVLVKERHQFL